MLRVGALALGVALAPVWALAERQQASLYVFGNSLVNHLSETSDLTNVPFWMNELARFEKRGFRLDGQWGFLRDYLASLPPRPNWSFNGVAHQWDTGAQSFGQAGFDAVVVTPANFIQGNPPDQAYDGENPDNSNPLGTLQALLDWVAAQSPESDLFVYEGWAFMQGGFPPSPENYSAYTALNAGSYHEWYLDLIDALDQNRPDYGVELIPVASVLARLLGEGGVLADLPAQAFYTDDAPHGTATLYFLAAMITYSWIYEVPPPEGYVPPALLHPDVVSRYEEIARVIWAASPSETAQAIASGQASGQSANAPASEGDALMLPPSGVRPEGLPALGFGLSGLADWGTEHPFVDMMRSARLWVGHTPEGWGTYSSEQLIAEGHVDEDGWPLSVPEGVTALEKVLLTDQDSGQDWLRGQYILTYEGSGPIKLSGRAKRVQYEDGRITFTYEPGDGFVGIVLTEVNAADPIRNIEIVKEEFLPLHEAGALFNPIFLDLLQDARSVRFMDWMQTNGSEITSWDERPTMETSSWTKKGVPVEVMIRLANMLGADPWFNMPHGADDDYVRQFAELVHRDLDPRLKAHVELSNEVWNQIFAQAAYAREKATAFWGESDLGWMQWYGLRAAQVMDIWAEVYGDDAPERLVRVVGTHTGWPGLEESVLQAPLAYLALGGRFPVDSFDAYAVTGYFGYELGTEDMAAQMEEWLDASEAEAVRAGEAEGLRRVALREYVKVARFDGAMKPVAEALAEGSLKEMTEKIFPYHANIARKNGLQFLMYEGGTHVVGHGGQVENERLSDFFMAFNYSPEMAKLYETLLGGWVSSGGTLFHAFVDVLPASRWGSWGALRHLQDSNPRWNMLMAYNATGPQWEERDLAAFANGVRALGSNAAEWLEGTPEEDYLIALGGNDELVSRGGADVLNGGAGRDLAELPGVQADYSFTREGDVLIAAGPEGDIRMFSIEVVRFEGAPEVEIAAETLGR